MQNAGTPVAQPGDDHGARDWIERSIELAELSMPEDDRKPRPRVGALIVSSGHILSEAFRNEDGDGGHAEELALGKLRKQDRGRLLGATLITTLEPCWKGRSPGNAECTWLLIKNGIRRVVIGMPDPDRETRNLGVEVLIAAGVQVDWFPWDLAQRVRHQNREFIVAHLASELPPFFL